MNKSEIMRVLLCLSRIEGKVAMALDDYLSEELTEVVDMLAKKILLENEDEPTSNDGGIPIPIHRKK